MNKLEIAKKLAKITGKPIGDFFNGQICEQNEIEYKSILYASEIGSNKETSNSEKMQSANSKIYNYEELVEYQKMFEGSKIVKECIHSGRQMTRKEYLKCTKNMTKKEYYKHPLMFKIFRAEGQNEPSFIRFSDRFKDED